MAVPKFLLNVKYGDGNMRNSLWTWHTNALLHYSHYTINHRQAESIAIAIKHMTGFCINSELPQVI